ncbi:hypothetical protein ES705_42157 [subsurface metagenome]
MMSLDLEAIIQYGFAGIALFMLYNIAYGHLTAIQTTLVEVKTILEDLRDGIAILVKQRMD